MATMEADLLVGASLYRRVILDKLAHARESVLISTANVKEMRIERSGRFQSILQLFAELSGRGVHLRLLHAELPSRPFRAAFDAREKLVRGGLELKICPRVHFKAVIVDGGWAYLGSANLTGAGLGAKADERRNFELGFATENFDVIDRATALFESIWSGAECATCKLRDLCPDPIGPAAPALRRGRARGSARGGVELGRSRRLRR